MSLLETPRGFPAHPRFILRALQYPPGPYVIFSAASLIWFPINLPLSHSSFSHLGFTVNSQTIKPASFLGPLDLLFLQPETFTLHLSPWPALLFLPFSAQISNRDASLAYAVYHCLPPNHVHHHTLASVLPSPPTPSLLWPPCSLSSLPYFVFPRALTVISLFICLLTIFPL